jgi:iron(III) transport system ATP-binding protein
MRKIALETVALNKSFGAVRAVDNLSIQVFQGEILALVGPSGCGKTTLLRMLAGFEQPDTGTIRLQDQLAAGEGVFLPPERRGVGMVFQDYALFPHLTVLENVAFGLKHLPKGRREKEVEEWLRVVGLQGFARSYPHELSGGERQRVALARALIPEPVLVLMDEPFSNLDADRRMQVREEVQAVLRKLNATVVFVTHDQEEALFMGDRLAVLNHGRLEQIDCPDTVFSQPATRFVAEFLGQTDFVAGEVTHGGILTEVGLVPQPLNLPPGARVELAVRADDVDVAPEGSPRGAAAQVVSRYYKGIYNVYRLALPSGQVLHSLQPHGRVLHPGQPVRALIAPGHDLACYHQGKIVI